MIPHGVEVFVGMEPIDLRWGFDRLAGVASERLGREPRSGALFVFFGKRRSALKVLFYDGTGMCLFYKRLDQGRFTWPSTQPTPDGTASITLTPAQLSMLLEGLEWRTLVRSRQPMLAG